MPGFDRTGPQGNGSLTGRGLGKCRPAATDANNESDNASTDQRLFGRGAGLGRGAGMRGRRGGAGRGGMRRGMNS